MMREYPSSWTTTGTAVPILTKLKVLPQQPNMNGQVFMNKELATPAWDANFRIAVEEDPSLKKLKSTEMVDIFACWFLVHMPHIGVQSIDSSMTFGFRDTFNGIGIFVFKEMQQYKIVAAQNMGTEQINLLKLNKIFKDGVNGCVLEKDTFDSEFVLHLRVFQSMISVAYGQKMRQSSHKNCFESLFVKNLNMRGFLGVTSRNSDRYTKTVDVGIVRIMNMDPYFYVESDDADEQEEEDQGQYTDTMEGHDIFEDYEDEQEQFEYFVNEFPGTIREEDTLVEVLYKMNEHFSHILAPVKSILANEESLRRFIKHNAGVPEKIRSYEKLPAAIEDESNFVQTIDFQLQKIKTLYFDVAEQANLLQ